MIKYIILAIYLIATYAFYVNYLKNQKNKFRFSIRLLIAGLIFTPMIFPFHLYFYLGDIMDKRVNNTEQSYQEKQNSI